VIVSGFLKKTQRTSAAEIARGRALRDEYRREKKR
jgi:hypothetical protein